MGNARIRQLRVQRNSCQVAGSMQQLVPGCHAPYSWGVEDTGSYGPGWNCSRNQTTSTPNPWKYQTQAELRAYPVWGSVSLYGGGGFAAELGPDLQNASRYGHLINLICILVLKRKKKFFPLQIRFFWGSLWFCFIISYCLIWRKINCKAKDL